MRMPTAKALARTLVSGALVLGWVVIASPGGSAQGDPPLYVSATPAGSQDCSSWANACTLSEALAVRTSANDQIEMNAGVYSSSGNDAINANGDLGANDDGVTIIGGYSGTTTLTPGSTCTGNGIVDFSGVSAVTVEGLTVDATGSTCGSPVTNTSGTTDTLGASPAALAVEISGGAPTTAAALSGGSTTLEDVTVDPTYTGDGVSCTGSASCTISDSTVTGTTGTTGVLVQGSAGATVGPSDVIADNADGGVVLQGSTASTVGPADTIVDNAAGGVLLEAASGALVDNNTITSNADGAVVGTSNGDQSSNDTVSGNTISGTTGAGVELETGGGYSITGNTVTGLGEGGEGFILVGSDNDTVSGNTVSGSAAGAIVTGNDLTGPSSGSTFSTNNFSSNLLGGAVADGFGSPESWNKPGSGNQGIQGVVFFQSDTAIAANAPITSTCPDTALTSCVEVVDPTAFSQVPGAYEGVANYLEEAGDTCDAGVSSDGGVPLGQDGDVATNEPNVVACTDGAGDIFLATPYAGQGAVVTSAITVGKGDATGASTTSEPGCESSPPPNTAQPPCTGSVLTLPTLTSYSTVASDNSFVDNRWTYETIAGAIDGSGPNGELSPEAPAFADADPADPTDLQNIWANNDCDPTTNDPVCDGSSASVSTTPASASIVPGDSDSDTATVTGNTTGGIPTGTVTFYECGPTATAEPCTSTANPVGSTIGLTAGSGDTASATSDSFTPDTPGVWCFAGYYSGDGSYRNSADTSTDECFSVVGMLTTLTKAFVTAGGANSDGVTVVGDASGGTPNGSVTFYACGPTTTPEPCTSTTNPVGNAVGLTAGPDDTATATSVSFIPDAPGVWCFAGYFSGDTNYPTIADTSTDGCFAVLTDGSVSGTVTDAETPPDPVVGALVMACGTGAEATNCYSFLTGDDGTFALPAVLDGTYTITVSPPSGSPLFGQTTSLFTVTGSAHTTEDIVLHSPLPTPNGTVISAWSQNTIGGVVVPTISAFTTTPITTDACSGGTVSVTVSGSDIVSGIPETSLPVTIAESPAGSGTFVGSLPVLYPVHGNATVTIAITNCPDPSQDGSENFNIYIDPSGTVLDADHDDAPVPGATVTLLSSDSLTGTFTPVADGSAVMSQGNRNDPDTTNAEGQFGWDTVAGFYEVRATEAGCGTTTTPAFSVPPAVENLQLVLHCASRLAMTTGVSLPGATRGVHYSTTVAAVGGNAPYTWKVAAGSMLPSGLTLHAHSGVISGRPHSGDGDQYSFTVKVLDKKVRVPGHPATRDSVTRTFTISLS